MRTIIVTSEDQSSVKSLSKSVLLTAQCRRACGKPAADRNGWTGSSQTGVHYGRH